MTIGFHRLLVSAHVYNKIFISSNTSSLLARLRFTTHESILSNAHRAKRAQRLWVVVIVASGEHTHNTLTLRKLAFHPVSKGRRRLLPKWAGTVKQKALDHNTQAQQSEKQRRLYGTYYTQHMYDICGYVYVYVILYGNRNRCGINVVPLFLCP